MLGFICRLMGYDIPEGPIVFVNNTQNVLPCSIYDVEPTIGDDWDKNLEDRINIDENKKEKNRGRDMESDDLILFSKNV